MEQTKRQAYKIVIWIDCSINRKSFEIQLQSQKSHFLNVIFQIISKRHWLCESIAKSPRYGCMSLHSIGKYYIREDAGR